MRGGGDTTVMDAAPVRVHLNRRDAGAKRLSKLRRRVPDADRQWDQDNSAADSRPPPSHHSVGPSFYNPP